MKKKRLPPQAEDLMNRKKILMKIESGQFDKALPKLEARYKNNPKDLFALRSIAFIYFQEKDYGKAMHYVLNALDVSPNDVQALKYKAWIYDKTGEPLKYFETLNHIIDSGVADWEVYDNLAEIYEQNGYFLEALDLFNIELKAMYTNKALDLYDIAQKGSKYNRPLHAVIGEANCYSRLGAYGIADEIYDMLLDYYSDKLEVVQNILQYKARNYYFNGDIVEAVNILLDMNLRDPDVVISKDMLNEIFMKMDAKNVPLNLQNKSEINSKLIPIANIKWGNNGGLHSLPEFDKWKGLWDEYNELSERGYIYEAKKKLEEILKIDNSIAPVWYCLAELHYTLFEISDAIYCCEKVLSLVKDFSEQEVNDIIEILNRNAKTLYVMALYDTGKLDKALEVAEEVISKFPNNYGPMLFKVRILNRKGDYAGGLSTLLPIMSIIPPELVGLANYILATSYFRLDNEKEFTNALYKSVELGNEFGTRSYIVYRSRIIN